MKKAWPLLVVGLAVLAAGVGWFVLPALGRSAIPIRVGLLHSLSGPMAISEKSMRDAEVLALEEIKARGGLLGRPVEWVTADGRSDWPTFAQEAERLIIEEKVDVIFGCWTSASRKMVLPVVERHKHMLVYPMAYEGLEESPNIIYVGSAPNQQIIPAVQWAYRDLKARRFFLVGSDYVWPHAVNTIINDQLRAIGLKAVGEEYIFFGSSDVDEVVARIKKEKPDVVLSSVVGDTNQAFYRRLREAGLTPDQVPVVSFSIAEDELRTMPPQDTVGDYASWNYFQSIPDRTENTDFVANFKARYGPNRVTSDVITAAYNGVRLWAQAVEECGRSDVGSVLNAIRRQSLDAPEGIISVEADNQHTWRPNYIGRIREDGQFDIVWSLQKPIRPVPYPITRSREEWDSFLKDLYSRWGGSWANPRNERLVAPAG